MNIGEKVLGSRVLGAISVNLKCWLIPKFTAASGEPLAEKPAVSIVQTIVGALVAEDGEIAPFDRLHLNITFPREVVSDGKAAIHPDFFGLGHIGVIVANADALRLGAQHSFRTGPSIQFSPCRSAFKVGKKAGKYDTLDVENWSLWVSRTAHAGRLWRHVVGQSAQ